MHGPGKTLAKIIHNYAKHRRLFLIAYIVYLYTIAHTHKHIYMYVIDISGMNRNVRTIIYHNAPAHRKTHKR